MTKENCVQNFLRSQSGRVVRLAPLVARNPTGEPLHQLRMATRRVRASLWVLRHTSSPTKYKSLGRRLKRLGKALGGVRELDVAILDAGRFGLDAQVLKTRQASAKRAVRKLTDQRHREALAKELGEFGLRAQATSPPSLRKARSLLLARLRAELKLHARSQGSFHRLRITLRKSLNEMKAMGVEDGRMVRLQYQLGKAHDLEFLQTALGKSPVLKLRQNAINKKCLPLVAPALRAGIRELAAS